MPLLRAIRAAGPQPWPRTFHALRASCETDWAATYPLADVAAWMGHSRAVAARCYLRPTDATFFAVTGKLHVTPLGGGGTRGGATCRNKPNCAADIFTSAAIAGVRRSEFLFNA